MLRLSSTPPLLSAVLLTLLAEACRPEPAAPIVPEPPLADVEPEVVEALTAARAAVRAEIDSAKAWGRLGDHYFVQHFNAEAAQCYGRASELDHESFVWPYRMALCLVKDRPEQAVEPLRRSLESLGNYAPAHELYGSVLLRLGREEQAREYLQRASRLDRSDPRAETALGTLAIARGDFEEARRHLDEALARDERHVEAHAALAQVYLALEQPEKARRHAELSRSLPQRQREWDALASPNLPPVGARNRTRLAQGLEAQGRKAEALEHYRAALCSNPRYYLARRNIACLLIEQGRREDALALLREEQRDNPAFERVQRDLACLQREGKLPDRARSAGRREGTELADGDEDE